MLAVPLPRAPAAALFAVVAALLSPAPAIAFPTGGFTIWTIAGTGAACSPATAACGDNAAATGANFYFPQGVTVDHGGNVIVSDTGDDRIRRFARGGNISTIAGTVGAACSPPTSGCGDNGPATSATLNTPLGVAVDGA